MILEMALKELSDINGKCKSGECERTKKLGNCYFGLFFFLRFYFQGGGGRETSMCKRNSSLLPLTCP